MDEGTKTKRRREDVRRIEGQREEKKGGIEG